MPIICWGNLAKSADETTRIEQSIQDYVEAHDENPNAHMGEEYALGAHRLQVALDHPYNSVGWFHILDMHAERITAGALVIKGDGPYIVVQDEAYNERVKIYPEGIIIKKGKIVIESDEDKVIVDERGLHGNNIFFTNTVGKDDIQFIQPGECWYQVKDLSLGLYLQRATPVMFFGNVQVVTNSAESDLALILEYPTGYFPAFEGSKSGWLVGWTEDAGTHGYSFSFVHIIHLYAGANLVNLLASNNSNPVSAVIAGGLESSLGYMILGNG